MAHSIESLRLYGTLFGRLSRCRTLLHTDPVCTRSPVAVAAELCLFSVVQRLSIIFATLPLLSSNQLTDRLSLTGHLCLAAVVQLIIRQLTAD